MTLGLISADWVIKFGGLQTVPDRPPMRSGPAKCELLNATILFSASKKLGSVGPCNKYGQHVRQWHFLRERKVSLGASHVNRAATPTPVRTQNFTAAYQPGKGDVDSRLPCDGKLYLGDIAIKPQFEVWVVGHVPGSSSDDAASELEPSSGSSRDPSPDSPDSLGDGAA
jgi:hypothetical protein